MLKTLPKELIKLMGDGEFHSGEDVGLILGVSRAAVWKKLQALEMLGIEVDSVKGRGYRFVQPLILLDKHYLCTELASAGVSLSVDVYDELASTNETLLLELAQGAEAGSVVVAESQLAGRGRRGRSWQSPFAKNIYMSLSASFDTGIASLDGLSLVVGLSVVEVLDGFGLKDAKLKWPNDVLYNDKKMAGILLEVAGDPMGLCHIVMGIGLNVNMVSSGGEIDQPWTSMCHESGLSVNRNDVIVALLKTLDANLAQFSRQGFEVFHDKWCAKDAYFGKEVVITLGNQQIFGVSHGISQNGELILETDAGVRIFNSGEVSLRLKL